MEQNNAQRFLRVDPLAEKYFAINPFAYVANNPLKFIDPDGMRIINPYEEFKEFSNLEAELRNNIKNASSKSDRKAARSELRANRENINGYNNYSEVESVLSEFKAANEEEFNRLDNLELNGVEIDVHVHLDNQNATGNSGQYGDTNYSYRRERQDIVNVTNFQTGSSYKLPTKISGDKIDIILYTKNRSLGTLANEFGDSIFAVENPASSYRDYELPYYQRASTHFSFNYEKYIKNPGKFTKPNPKDY